ncbi:MAG: RAMP superfamily CRISPR-associated protein [Synechococcales bacterium]|nr:RAMP superfamily CRISPR-associated protein [Synechococcales bacterium]
MHKRLVNHCTIHLTIIPDGPILIKSGKEGADPTKPDMEFVETYHERGKTIYLPGSSLKGALRAHAERIVRTVGGSSRPTNSQQIWASDPMRDDAEKYFQAQKVTDSQQIYQQSCFIGQLFGNTSIASRLRIEDAYPTGEVKLEERNGVAIDRVFGSVAVGPFNYQVCTKGEFKTKIHLKNFTLPQLGLLGLVLRDLNDGWFGLGFAKSRGLGTVAIQYDKATVQYPGCILENDRIKQLGAGQTWERSTLLGVGMFLTADERENYGFPADDRQTDLPVAAEMMSYGFGVELVWSGAQVEDLLMRSVQSWSKLLQGAAA